jgi:hypothetical protein
MIKPNYYLIAGGIMSALISILHILLALQPEFFKYIAPGQESTLTQMAVQGSTVITIAAVALALMFALWAAYAFSGAGLIHALPILRAALIVIGVMYISRALFLPSEINMVLTQGYPFRFVIFSTSSLLVGLFYLIGFWRLRAVLKLAKKS